MSFPRRHTLMLLILGIPLILLSMFTLDQQLSLYFKRPELTPLWLQARNITNVGLSEHYFILAALLYVFGKWVRPQFQRTREFGRDFFFSLITGGVMVHLVKFCFGRQRPHLSADLNPWVFHPLTTHWDFHSFASGHAQVMFTVATVFSLRWPKGRWAYFLIAAFFAFTRVIIHDHFLSDVIAGAMIGCIGTWTAFYMTSCLAAGMPS